MKAILSDIHANLEALEAVLRDLAAYPSADVYCLGDVLGYGPDPVACLDLVMGMGAVVILGNHDQLAMFDPDGYSSSGEPAIFWTRAQLGLAEPADLREKRWEFLAERPRSHREDGFLYVHGSPRNPLNEYVFPEDVYNPRKMEINFALIQRYCFAGHTHVPGVFVEAGPDRYEFFSPEELGGAYRLDGRKALINVGSVGQPRDGDWRACYVLLDGDAVRFRRLEYDVEATVRKIYAVPELENFLGDRLRDGR